MISLLQFSHCTIWRVKSLLITLLCIGLLAQGKPIDSGISMIDASTDSTTVDSTLAKQTDSSGGVDRLLHYDWLTSDGPKIEHPDGRTSFEIVQNGGKKTSDTKASLRAAPLSTLDYQPLMDLYNGTNGPNWTNHTGWGNGTDPCTGNGGQPWFGLTCNNGRVSEVLLTNNNLVGSLPGSLSMLTGLTVLQINQNSQLSGSIPTGLGNLTALIGLELDNNDLTGSIPTDLSTLTNLKALSLQYNRLAGTIPANLSTNLEKLDLQHNQLTGNLPANLIAMTKIQYIILSVNQLTGTIPTDLSPLTSLLNFNLSENQLTGNIPTSLPASLQGYELQSNQLTGSLPTNLPLNIERLNLNDNQLTGSLPVNLNTLTKLTILNLYNNQLTGSLPANLPSNIETLDLNNNQLTGSLPTNLNTLTNLKVLNLNDNQLTGSLPANLPTNIETLNLNDNLLTGNLPTNLNTLTNLKVLNLNDNQLTGSIPANLGALTKLTILNLYNNQLTGSLPANLPSNIETLDLNNNQLTGSLPTNLNTLTNLKVLNLNDNQLTGSIPANLGTLTKLTILNLSTNQLSGCFPSTLTALCGGGRSIGFQNNPDLPGAGDFAAFCSRGFGSAGFVAQASASPTSVCIQSVVSLSANGGSGYSYNWLSPTGTTLSSNSDQSVSATLSTSGVKTFTVVISSGSSCSSTATVNVTVNNLSAIKLSASTACAGSPVTLSATSGLSSYTFTGPSGTLSGAGNTRLVLSLTAGTYSFSVAAVNASGCLATDQLSLVVSELPTATLTSSGTLTCDQRTVTLTASGGDSYTFTRGGVIVGTPGSTNTIDVTTAGTYTVRVANATGCVSTTTTNVVSTIATINVDNPATTFGIKNVAFSQTFSASGGHLPVVSVWPAVVYPTD
ncbi:hypothetical protein GO730_29920 [Spirosoma sp. HMF3257]|uniref:PKD/Chitinase domain-containing protein n=1 Tax=Spirosoma telluris TaxID=2183553 RepID=A0A327NQ48_9BACT|nr:hypothetical protein [Spirosoma telluris]RAI77327.1 hypothetical protein HMF3257_29830 [Spirosoma telluris]